MIKLVGLAFALAVASSAQALPVAPIEPDSFIVPARQACGPGMHRVGAACVRTPARRQAARCAAGRRFVDGRCI
jgi:hypothetical protein